MQNVILKSAFTTFCHVGNSIVYMQRLRKGVKILMAVVIGALVLAGLYALFGETILPQLKTRIIEMFNYGD